MNTTLLEFQISAGVGQEWKLARRANEGLAAGYVDGQWSVVEDTEAIPARVRLRWVAGHALTLDCPASVELPDEHRHFRLDGDPITPPTAIREGQLLEIGRLKITWRHLPRNEWPTLPALATGDRRAPGAAMRLAEELKEGRYQSGTEVGRGGMGKVLTAQEKSLRRPVAVKVLLAPGENDHQERFIREARITGSLQHPSIVPVHELNVDEDGKIFYTMKLVQGMTLHDLLKRLWAGDADTLRRYPLAALLTIFQKVCDGVAFAHSRAEPVIHRDLKPENIMVGDYGEVLVMDWGTAKILQAHKASVASSVNGGPRAAPEAPGEEAADFLVTRAGSVMGTPGYMAPEQARGQADIADERTDIFALGGILYALLTLEAPSRVSAKELQAYEAGENSTEAARTFHRQVAPLLSRGQTPLKLAHLPGRSVPDSLVPVALKAMALRSGDRFESVTKLQADVASYQAGFATSAEQARAWKRLKLLIARHKTFFSALAVTFSILLAATAVSLHQRKAAMQSNAGLQLALQRASSADLEAARQRFGVGAWREGLALLGRSLTLWPGNRTASNYLLSAVVFGRDDLDKLPLFGVEHQGRLSAADFSPDGQRFVTSSFIAASRDSTVQVWNVQTGAQVSVNNLRGMGPVCCTQFSPDGRKVLTTTEDGYAQVWDARTGLPLTAPLAHGDPSADVTRNVETGVFSPDGRRILTACWDHTARLWDAETGREIARLPNPNRVASAVFNRDGTRILTCYWRGGAMLWDARTFRPVGVAMPHDATVRKACFSPDGSRVVTASLDHTARIWDARTGLPMTPPILHPDAVWTLAISPDGSLLATACYDKTARLWSMVDGSPIGSPMAHDAPVVGVAFSPDGTRLLTSSRDTTARIWDVHTCRSTGEWMHHDETGGGAIFSPDGSRILSICGDHMAYLWLTRSAPEPGKVLPIAGEVISAEFTADPDHVFLATRDGQAGIWSLASGQFITPTTHGAPIAASVFSRATGRFATAGSDGAVQFWDSATGAQVGSVPGKHGELTALIFSADGSALFTASLSGSVCKWKVPEGTQLASTMEHPERMDTLALAPSGKELATACRDGFVRFWDAETGSPLPRTIRFTDPTLALDYAPDGRTLAIGGGDHTARVWSLEHDAPVGKPMLCKGPAACVRYTAGGRALLMAGPEDSDVNCYDPRFATSIRFPMPHATGVVQITSSQDGSRIVTVARDGRARLWEIPELTTLPPAWLADYVRALGGLTFSTEQQLTQVSTRERIRLRASLLAGEPDATPWDAVRAWSFERAKTGATDPWQGRKH